MTFARHQHATTGRHNSIKPIVTLHDESDVCQQYIHVRPLYSQKGVQLLVTAV